MSSFKNFAVMVLLALTGGGVLLFSLYVNWLLLDLHITSEQSNSLGGKLIGVMALIGCLAAAASVLEKDINLFRGFSIFQWFAAYVFTVCLILPEASNYGQQHPGAGQGADFVLYGSLFGGAILSAPGAMISFLGTLLLSGSFTMYKERLVVTL